MPIPENVAISLKRYKDENHLTLTQLAALLDIPLSSVQNYCSGSVNMRTDVLEHIPKATGIPLAELIFGKIPSWDVFVYLARAAAELPPEIRDEFIRSFLAIAYQYSEAI